MTKPTRILLTRTDNLGDVLLTLPAIEAVRRALPDAELDFLLRPELVALLGPWLAERKVRPVEWRGTGDWSGYRAVLCLFDEPRLLGEFKRQGVGIRVGNYSKLRSFLRLTHGVRQKRGRGLRNEAEYNLDLVKLFLGVLGASFEKPALLTLPRQPSAQAQAGKALDHIGVAANQPYWIAHPGMGGSALNLRVPAYLKLLEQVAAKVPGELVLSLGPARQDLELVEALVDANPSWRVLPRVSLEALAEVYRGAKLVVAPSTGPLHLAHYVGTPTLGIYSPVRSHHPRRWAPWGGSGVSEVLVPTHSCPGKKDCLGPKCARYFCLDRLVGAGLPLELRGVLKA